MNGIAFGKELKKIRTSKGVASKELSQSVGKAVTYVSQLERGLIKKPDYYTCQRIMEKLDIDSSRIEGILDHYGIQRPEIEEMLIAEAEKHSSFDWMEQNAYRLKNINKQLCHSLDSFIDRDLSKAEEFIPNLLAMMQSEEDFDFIYKFFKNDISSISSSDKKELLSLTLNFINSKYELNEWNDLVKKGLS